VGGQGSPTAGPCRPPATGADPSPRPRGPGPRGRGPRGQGRRPGGRRAEGELRMEIAPSSR